MPPSREWPTGSGQRGWLAASCIVQLSATQGTPSCEALHHPTQGHLGYVDRCISRFWNLLRYSQGVRRLGKRRMEVLVDLPGWPCHTHEALDAIDSSSLNGRSSDRLRRPWPEQGSKRPSLPLLVQAIFCNTGSPFLQQPAPGTPQVARASHRDHEKNIVGASDLSRASSSHHSLLSNTTQGTLLASTLTTALHVSTSQSI